MWDDMGAQSVLLVDDEPQVLEMIGLVLERARIPVFTADSPNQAVSVWKAHQPEIRVIVADMDLKADISGFELIQRLRKENPMLRSILISAHPVPNGLDGGADWIEFFQKPFDLRELIETVRSGPLRRAA